MNRKNKPRRKASANHPAQPAEGKPRPVVNLTREGFKRITLAQLDLSADEMQILSSGARQVFPSCEATSAS
jgi:hypothetical protein